MKNPMKRLALLMVAVWIPATAGAQPFVSTTAPAVAPTIFGSVTLADFDGDGAMDVLVTGSESGQAEPVARVYRNNGRVPDGTWSFADVQATFPDAARYLSGLRASSADVADFDNDGDLDVLIAGAGGTAIYRNEGSYRFTAIRLRDEALTERESYFVDIVTTSAAAWGDYDNDGDLDVLLTARAGSFIYRNDGFARFTQVDVGLPGLPNGIVSWGDYDNDGDLDILAVARPFREQPATTRIYRNDAGAFVSAEATLPGIEAGTVKWGDYDADGDLDILIMSRLFSVPVGLGGARGPGIFRNDRGVFSQTPDTLPSAWYGDWVDFDNDGDLDVLVNGLEGNGTFAQFVRNDGGRLSYRTPTFSGIWFGDIATGDLDGDGRVEVLMNGRYQIGSLRQNSLFLYRNVAPGEWSSPPAPTALAARRDGDRLVLAWRSPYADIEKDPSLTYNVRVGTTPGGSDILAPMSLTSGKRLVSEAGNAGHNLSISIRGLSPQQTFYWTVQSVDHRLVGSSFAIERIAYGIPPPAPPTPEPVVTENYPNPFNPTTTIRFSLPVESPVRLVVYNVLGAEVSVLVDQSLAAGTHQAVWNATDAAGRPLPSGLYLYALETSEARVTRTMLLLK